jgi:CHASE2 domain-containing sensor protein
MKRVFVICFLAFSLACSSQDSDKIVLIGVEEANRFTISTLLEKVCAVGPKVVGVNLFFFGETVQFHDAALMGSIYNCTNIVLASDLVEIPTLKGGGLEIINSLHIFASDETTGFANFLDKNLMPQYFSTFEIVDATREYHFSVHVAMMFDSLKTSDFLLHNDKVLEIDYRQGKRKFTKLTLDEILLKDFNPNVLKDKIVLVGYLGPSDEDKFITPLKANIKSSKPDMYGTEILANIILQILEE